MVQPKALLDTDILSAVMRGNPVVTARVRAYLAEHGALAFSIITRYEILRGLKAKNATSQLQAFDRDQQRGPLPQDLLTRRRELAQPLKSP